MDLPICNMKPEDIRAELVRAKVTHSAIARSLKPPVTPRAVGLVIEGLSTSRRIQEAIASAISVGVREIWPAAPRKPGRPKSREIENPERTSPLN